MRRPTRKMETGSRLFFPFWPTKFGIPPPPQQLCKELPAPDRSKKDSFHKLAVEDLAVWNKDRTGRNRILSQP